MHEPQHRHRQLRLRRKECHLRVLLLQEQLEEMLHLFAASLVRPNGPVGHGFMHRLWQFPLLAGSQHLGQRRGCDLDERSLQLFILQQGHAVLDQGRARLRLRQGRRHDGRLYGRRQFRVELGGLLQERMGLQMFSEHGFGLRLHKTLLLLLSFTR